MIKEQHNRSEGKKNLLFSATERILSRSSLYQRLITAAFIGALTYVSIGQARQTDQEKTLRALQQLTQTLDPQESMTSDEYQEFSNNGEHLRIGSGEDVFDFWLDTSIMKNGDEIVKRSQELLTNIKASKKIIASYIQSTGVVNKEYLAGNREIYTRNGWDNTQFETIFELDHVYQQLTQIEDWLNHRLYKETDDTNLQSLDTVEASLKNARKMVVLHDGNLFLYSRAEELSALISKVQAILDRVEHEPIDPEEIAQKDALQKSLAGLVAGLTIALSHMAILIQEGRKRRRISDAEDEALALHKRRHTQGFDFKEEGGNLLAIEIDDDEDDTDNGASSRLSAGK